MLAIDIDKTDDVTLRSGFVRNALLRPSAAAYRLGEVVRSYGEVDELARTWAGAICSHLGRPARRVGVFAYRSEPAYAGVLAALFAGGAFVPLNRTFPVERTRAMLRLADLDAVIVDEASAEQLPAALDGLDRPPLVLRPDRREPWSAPRGVEAMTSAELGRCGVLTELPPVLPQEPAYLLFTSGTTGLPKGVPITHGNVTHFIRVVGDRYRFTPDDRFSQTFEQTIDLSVYDLIMAWECGGCVCGMQTIDLLAPSLFAKKHELSVWFSVPSLPAMMRKKRLLKPNSFPTLQYSLFCGEPLPRASAEAWQEAAPQSTLENLYGPTELTIACFAYRWDPRRSPGECLHETVPIGRPFPGLGAIVVDDRLCRVPEGQPGELLVTGPQTSPGYWRDPEKTTERFVWVAGSALDTLQFYRTGDRVSRLPSGDYVYLGRADQQIKVRGYRVELGEIEAALRKEPNVVDAAALGWPIEDGTAQGIVAFISGRDVEVAALREQAGTLLPDYMVPREIRVLESLPLNPNGKVDRKALAALLHG